MSKYDIPIVVDLDGTLIQSDILFESFFNSLPKSIFQPHRLLKSLCDGKSHLKSYLSDLSKIDICHIPYNKDVLELLKKYKSQGTSIVLATATHRVYADAVAKHLGIFDLVIATEGSVNLSARNKRDALVTRFGDKGFDYMGNSHDDLCVWASSRKAILVNPDLGVERKARALVNVDQVLRTKSPVWKVWPRALRFHQWVKNLLLFVPLLAAHRIWEIDLLFLGLMAFVSFSLCASSVYLLNDLLDLEDDRHHPTKSNRPFASGALPLHHGVMAIPALLCLGFSLSLLFLPAGFTLALAAYYGLTLAYSLTLKRLMMVDVITLASLYTLRIIAGSLAFGVELTFWMLAFSMFLFLSLALVKRYAELHQARKKGGTAKAHGRDYYPGDLQMVSSLGAAAGYLAVLVLALYIQDESTLTLYSRPEMIWLACPVLLFWISRVWMITHRGGMQDDPVLFAVKDTVSLLTGVLFGLAFWMAI
ncbi:UbiA family prenyltransferase [Desulfonatronum sp. SC1]|uniref:UbiA family prenyltransferase n=1 Tax=Desulfonatronum sp. SC1 TaxID=2109626 RepID=UPI000D30DFC6|nr:UbiA family prenyltransferase [Desulfonatronum sp. SC1]PTN33197.1 UbiA family prenyltransferase [Desulfonatronum sp. SC1]